jgi:hypothetical protein
LIAGCAESQAFLDELTARAITPTEARWTLYDTFICDLVTDGLFSKIDRMKVLAAADEAIADVDLAAPSAANDMTKVNSPTFTADRGYTGNSGSTAYLDLNFQGGDLTKFVASNACVGAYTRQWSRSNSRYVIGVTNGSVHGTRLNPSRSTSDAIIGQITSTSSDNGTAHGTGGLGLHTITRTGGAEDNFANGVDPGGFNTSGSVKAGGLDWYGLAYNQNGTATNICNNGCELSFYFVSSHMTAAQQATMFTRVEALMDGIGAGVV